MFTQQPRGKVYGNQSIEVNETNICTQTGIKTKHTCYHSDNNTDSVCINTPIITRRETDVYIHVHTCTEAFIINTIILLRSIKAPL